MTPTPDTERRYTIRQWEKLKGIKILDPDGFNRKNPDLMECLFTEQEFDDGAMGSTIQSISPTKNTEELEKALLVDPVFQHILKFAPQSQRELMTFELAKYFASREHQAVQAFGEKVLKDPRCFIAYSKRNPDGSRQRVPEKMVIPVSVITSLLKGANQ